MAKYTSVLNQLLNLIPRDQFAGIVARHQGDRGVRRLSCWSQLVALFYAQLTGQHTLRDLVTALNMAVHKLQHVGLTGVSRSTLADANRQRPSEIFRELFEFLYARCRQHAPGHGFRFQHKVYSLDATTVNLCLKVFDWAKFRRRKGAIKLHLKLDHQGQIPSFCVLTPGKTSDIEVARQLAYEPDSILVFDRGYVDYHWFGSLTDQGVFFVTRLKSDAVYRVRKREPVEKDSAVTSDQRIRLTGKAAQCLKTDLRRIGYRDPETGKFYAFLTNILHLGADEIAQLYRSRWQIELFFKWVKQHLKIKSFLGTSRNAVMTQVWMALCVYLLVAYLKFMTKVPWRLYEVYKRIQAAALEYVDLKELLQRPLTLSRRLKRNVRQLNMFPRRLKPLTIRS